MNEQQSADSELDNVAAKKSRPAVASSNSTQTPAPNPSAKVNENAVKELTTEEQMALYEKDLKENDWGHQPC